MSSPIQPSGIAHLPPRFLRIGVRRESCSAMTTSLGSSSSTPLLLAASMRLSRQVHLVLLHQRGARL